MPTLSVCLIVRNEEAHLARCLESVRGLWDDLVVVDTGSTDGTVEIARSFGARVFNFTWCDDFSAARNFCLEQVTGDWILSLDADETIAARDHAVIRKQMRRADLHAVTVVQRHYLAGTVIGWQPGSGGYDEGTPYAGYLDTEVRRLFRNRPWLRFENRVHEILVTKDPAKPIVHIHGGWVIHHFGKVGAREVLRAKGEHYLRILLKKAEERPDDPQTHHELGVQYNELGQPAPALASFKRVLALSPGYADTLLHVAICHVGLQQPAKAFAALRLAQQTLPHLAAEIALAEGNLHRDQGDIDAAERTFLRGAAANPGFAAVSVNLTMLYHAQHRHADALACVELALTHNPTHPDLLTLQTQQRRLRARALAQERRFDEARAYLDTMAGEPDADVGALRGAVALEKGELDEAIGYLRSSLALEATHEAALNLSIALQARGDHAGALAAAADAVGLSIDEPAAVRRFAELAGETLRQRRQTDAARPLTLFFYMPRGAVFDARTPRTRGLGGTESAVVYLAEALTRLGHRVAVFNQCEEPGDFDGVEYARVESLASRAVADRPDVVVAVRDWRLIGQARLAPLQIFWTLDAYDQPFLKNLADRRARAGIDFYMLGSDWQAATLETHFGVPAWQTVQLRNGTAISATDAPAPAADRSRPRKLAYASTPFRGLDVLLDVFPRIRAACPDAELDVYSSMRVYGWNGADDQQEFGALYDKARQPGVNLVGTVPQLELAERLQQARVLAYPNHYAETFCIAAIEAQAAGCVVVTTALGALPQTVGEGGICIGGDPRSAEYQDAFVAACVSLLTDDARWQEQSMAALARSWTAYAWPAVAAEWDVFCRAALAGEPPIVGRVALHLAAGRTALAQKMLQRDAAPAGVPASAWSALTAFTAWRAGAGEPPAADTVREAAIHFPSIRNLSVQTL